MSDIRYDDIVPSDIRDELIVIRDSHTAIKWRTGDLVWMALSECAADGKVVTRETMCAAFGSFIGKSARTIREYATVSRFYDAKVRIKYEVLAYDYFRVAMRLGHKWKDALDWAVMQVDKFNRPATVDAMLLEFGSDVQKGDPGERTETSCFASLLTILQSLKRTLCSPNMPLKQSIIQRSMKMIEDLEKDIAIEIEQIA